MKRIAIILVMILVILFCGFGWKATFESTENALLFRAIYKFTALASIGVIFYNIFIHLRED